MDVFEQAAQDSADHQARIEARARLITAARGDGLAGHRETIRLLTIVVALDPYTQATTAPPGHLGRPIGPTDAELGPPRTARVAADIPRQPRPLRNPDVKARSERQALERARRAR